jgi:hypothetical protein
MKKTFAITIIVFAVTTITFPVRAKIIVEPSEINCAEFLKYDANQQEDIVYSLKEELGSDEGIKIKGINVEKINAEGIANEQVYLEKLGDKENYNIIKLCRADKRANLFNKLKTYWKNN